MSEILEWLKYLGSLITLGLSLYFLPSLLPTIFEFLKNVFPKIIKWGFIGFLLTLGSSLFIFVIYHIIYGSAIGLSRIVNYKTINIIIYSTIGVLGYMLRVVLFKE